MRFQVSDSQACKIQWFSKGKRKWRAVAAVWDKMITFGAFMMYLCMMWSSAYATNNIDRANVVARYWSTQANISRHTRHHQQRVSWWQSPVIMAEVRRRVTGNENTTFAQYFKSEMVVKKRAGRPFQNGLSLGSGHGKFSDHSFDVFTSYILAMSYQATQFCRSIRTRTYTSWYCW